MEFDINQRCETSGHSEAMGINTSMALDYENVE